VAGSGRFGRALRIAVVIAALVCSQACLVLSLSPAYDDDSIAWDPGLSGQWTDSDDNMSLTIEPSEWRSYRIHYEHPSEKGDLTGFLTIVGDDRYLDVMPLRGTDPGSFLLPVHAILRVTVDGDQLTVTPLSYDWFSDRLRAGRDLGHGLSALLDENQHVLITSSTADLRGWLRSVPASSAAWGAPAVFSRAR
jgi:hypothetical protein